MIWRTEEMVPKGQRGHSKSRFEPRKTERIEEEEEAEEGGGQEFVEIQKIQIGSNEKTEPRGRNQVMFTYTCRREMNCGLAFEFETTRSKIQYRKKPWEVPAETKSELGAI